MGWETKRIQDGVLRSLDSIEPRLGYKVPRLRDLILRLSEIELAEMLGVVDLCASMIDTEMKVAHKVIPVEDFVKWARRHHGTRRRANVRKSR